MKALLSTSEIPRANCDWKAVDRCRSCSHPNAQGSVRCGGCGRLSRFDVKTVTPQVIGTVARWLRQGLEFTILGLLVLVVLAVAVRLAPLLVVFPLVLLALPPSASRGGRTVVRRRSPRSPEMVRQRLV